jgi:hypothetical protein
MVIIKSQSGVNSLRHCVLGHGATEPEAWEDAFGPPPYTDYENRAKARAWAVEATPEEEEDIHMG